MSGDCGKPREFAVRVAGVQLFEVCGDHVRQSLDAVVAMGSVHCEVFTLAPNHRGPCTVVAPADGGLVVMRRLAELPAYVTPEEIAEHMRFVEGRARLRKMLDEVRQWRLTAIPSTTALGYANHLRKEADEVRNALVDGVDVAAELADVIMLADAVAHMKDVDLALAVQEKFRIVRSREYLPPDADGVCSHKPGTGVG